MTSLETYLLGAAALFAIGLFGVLTRRNAIAILMGLELMFNAVNINLIAFARYRDPSQVVGQIFTLVSITVAAAEAAVALAIVIAIYRSLKHTSVDELNLMKW